MIFLIARKHVLLRCRMSKKRGIKRLRPIVNNIGVRSQYWIVRTLRNKIKSVTESLDIILDTFFPPSTNSTKSLTCQSKYSSVSIPGKCNDVTVQKVGKNLEKNVSDSSLCYVISTKKVLLAHQNFFWDHARKKYCIEDTTVRKSNDEETEFRESKYYFVQH